MIELFMRGGMFFMMPLLGASVVVITLAVERFTRFRRAHVDYDAFLDTMRSALGEGGPAAAREVADDTPGPVARVWSEGLRGHRLPFPLIRERMESTALSELSRLEKHLHHLSIIGQLAPLVGILGTVWGMIVAFQVIEGGLAVGGGIQSDILAGGIWKALITTVGGLLVGIPALLLHHYLSARVHRFAEDLERSVADLVSCLIPLRARAARAGIGDPQPVAQAVRSSSRWSAPAADLE